MQHNLKATSRAWGGKSSLGNVGYISVCLASSPTTRQNSCAHRLCAQPWLGTSCSQLEKGVVVVQQESLPRNYLFLLSSVQPPSLTELCQAS